MVKDDLMKRIEKDLVVRVEKIDEEIVSQGALVFWYGTKMVEAMNEAELAKLEVDRIYAVKREQYRKLENGDKMTEGRLNALVEKDEDYIKIRKEYIEKNTKAVFWKIVYEGIKQKKDLLEMIVQLRIVSRDIDTRNIVERIKEQSVKSMRQKLDDVIKEKKRR